MIFIAGLAFLPLIHWPGYVVAYEVPRVYATLFWIEAIAILTMLLVFQEKIALKLNIDILRRIGVFVGIAVIASLLGGDIAKSFLGNYYRVDGLLTLVHAAGFAILVALTFRDAWQVPAAAALFMGGLFVSIWAIVLAPRPIPKIGGPFGQPNFLGGYLVVTLPFLYYLITTSRRRWLRALLYLGGLMLVSTIVLTRSWGSVASVLVFGLLILSDWLPTRAPRRLLWAAGILAVASLLLYKWYTVSLYPPQILAESRQRIFAKGVLAWMRQPIFGWGWANFDHGFNAVDWPYHFQTDAYVDKAHSSILEVFVTTGAVGGLAYLVLLWGVFQTLRRGTTIWDRAMLWVFLVALFHAQTNVTSFMEELLFWFAVGLALQRNLLTTVLL